VGAVTEIGLTKGRHDPGSPPSDLKRPRDVLIVEDNEQSGQLLARLLERDAQYHVDRVANGEEALQAAEEKPYDIVITDLRMPTLGGMDLIQELNRRENPSTIIVTTGHGSIAEAVRAIRLGAYDFLTKPVNIDDLRLVIDRAIRERGLRDEVSRLRAQLRGQFPFQNLLSKSPRMQAIFELIRNLAETTTTVLIEGETGTGKEQVARAIHQASSLFRTGELVAVNCAALPETLLESELFGHEKGSFTGATGQRKGRFEMARGGTLFLDEVGDIPGAMQAKLLRVLQERKFERVGGTESIEVDVRVVAATNRSLARLVKRGKFREDLYYRLNVVKIDLPPLRERMEDLPLLVAHFASKYSRPNEPPKEVSAEAMEVLLSYSWPGNIRELENVVERLCVTSQGKDLLPEDLKAEVNKPREAGPSFAIDLQRPMTEFVREIVARVETQYIKTALRKARGHVGRCARICGLSRRCITSKLAEYKIDKDVFKNL
jgi:DNA-binding NtrC family response regulator